MIEMNVTKVQKMWWGYMNMVPIEENFDPKPRDEYTKHTYQQADQLALEFMRMDLLSSLQPCAIG